MPHLAASGPALRTPEAATATALWEAARLTVRPELLKAALAEADAERLSLLARAHGLAGMLRRAMEVSGCPDMLGPAGDVLAQEAELRRLEGLVLLPHALRSALQPLVDAGLEPLVFKGPSIAVRYPAPGLRSMLDLDVILPPSDHPRAVEILRGAGWAIASNADRDHYETILQHPDVPSLMVDLHRGLDTWFQRSAAIALDDLWQRRVANDCLGTSAYGLPREVEMVALAAHAGKPFHTFSRLIWIVDLTVVASDGIDWDGVARLSRVWRCRTMLAVSLVQARRLGLDVPSEMMEIGGSSLRRRALEPALDLTWPLEAGQLGSRNRLRYALADRWTRRMVLFVGLPAPAPWWTWPGRYAEDLLRALHRIWTLWRGHRPSRR